MPPPLALMLLSHMMTFPATLDNARVTDIATVFKSLLDSSIPRQFSSPCSICSICSICSTVLKSLLDMLDMLDSFLATPPTTCTDVLFYRIWWLSPPHWTMLEWSILRQFSNPCSIVRYLNSFSICSTVFRPCPHHSHWCCYRIWWLSPPHWTMLEWPILRQFSSPCSIVRYLDSFQVPARYARQFLLDMLDSFWKRPPPLALTFLSHMMTFPATLDNTTPNNINTFRKIYWLKAPRHKSLKNCRTENRPISWLSSEPAIYLFWPYHLSLDPPLG